MPAFVESRKEGNAPILIPIFMIQKLTLIVFCCIWMLGCQDSVNNIELPKQSLHNIHIEGDILFHGEVIWSASDDSINTKIEVENIGTDTAKIEAGPCAFNVIAYSKDNEPVWYNRPPNNYICPDILIIYRIAPKETKQLTDQMYISGINWHWKIPDGDWNFIIKSRAKEGETISFSAKEIQIN